MKFPKKARPPEPKKNLEKGDQENPMVPEEPTVPEIENGIAADPPPKPPKQKAVVKPPPEDDGRPKVALRVFIGAGGIRWDQMAGFKSYAKRLKMGPLSILEWRAAYTKFMKRPV